MEKLIAGIGCVVGVIYAAFWLVVAGLVVWGLWELVHLIARS